MNRVPPPTPACRRLAQGLLLGASLPLGWGLCDALLAPGQADAGYRLAVYGFLLAFGALACGSFGYALGRREAQLARLSSVDHLTGLANSRTFQESFDREFANAGRYGQPLALVLLDVDHFKKVNDVYGHQTGDAALASVARTVQEAVRAGDLVARVGGEEFAVIMPGTTSRQGFVVAERIRRAVRAMHLVAPGGRIFQVSVSLGVAGLDRFRPSDAREFFARVDQALYEAKDGGRDRTVVVSDGQLPLPYTPSLRQ